ncbi:hypothetical protein [Qipengyuania nanhaisediminis]|uniref:hypothetical protein n=1 Tax=Qipengyuania nanhaisediminis TaxID=604088 RepID=UPI0038B37A16
MDTPFETGPGRYQPASDYPYAADPQLRFDQRRLARVVGFIAFAMPIVLGVGGHLLGRFRTALSGYYYEPVVLGDFFVGCLALIGALLLAYRGWTPKVARLASIAGIAALTTAFVPMGGWITGCEVLSADGGCSSEAVTWPRLGYWVHAISAGILFAILAFFCLFVFTKVPASAREGSGEPSRAKQQRNAVYVASGVTIALAALGIGIGGQFAGSWFFDHHITFWLEAVILGAFGVSWLVQGRAVRRLADPQDRVDAAIAKSKRAQR